MSKILMFNDFEIAKMYREARDKRAQISIMRDLNCCTIADICAALMRQGINDEIVQELYQYSLDISLRRSSMHKNKD